MIFLYSDLISRAGGIETYLHALALHLLGEGVPFRVVITERESCPLIDELIEKGVEVYRQKRTPGDRWLLRQRVMMAWLFLQLKPGDWIFCVRQPLAPLYLSLVRMAHRRGARIAASWMLAPEFLPPTHADFCAAVAETDAVISVSMAAAEQYKSVYNYHGPVHIVPYHNLPLFNSPLPLPPGPPWKIGYMGRLEIKQKFLDQLLTAFLRLSEECPETELHIHGHGPDRTELERMAQQSAAGGKVFFHGGYDHRHDLREIMERCHFFVYPSRYEGGPCFTLLELMQAGRFCVAANVGGIPDLYHEHPEAGILVEPENLQDLVAALRRTVRRVSEGSIDGDLVRSRYLSGFDASTAHRAWLNALS
jgi:glycosyltransferase involved in cell wall biosynthesis